MSLRSLAVNQIIRLRPPYLLLCRTQSFLYPHLGAFQLGKKLYVGNLSHNIGKSDLEQMFTAYGTVISAQVINDRGTGQSKGFGFVEMGTDQEAQAAISALSGKSIDGRNLMVNEARPQESRSGGRGSGGGRRGGGSGRY